MSVRSFRSVFMVASCAGAALGCYLVSLRVASERAALENVETQIVLAQRDIRLLQTEIGTRGRLAQLERWNARVIALSAPTADQFLKSGFELARLTAPEHRPALEAPVVLASAPAQIEKPSVPADSTGSQPSALLHQASLTTSSVAGEKAVAPPPAEPMRRLQPAKLQPAAKAKVKAEPASPKAPLAMAKPRQAAKDSSATKKQQSADVAKPKAKPVAAKQKATPAIEPKKVKLAAAKSATSPKDTAKKQ